MAGIRKIWNSVNRRKPAGDILQTELSRCLNVFDVTMLGIGHMMGAGVYVISGTIIRYMAGPGAVLSFLFAGCVAILAALCYAEFGARVPKAGSAYFYTYITIGELWGFLVGWNIILEHLIGAASLARSFSAAVDSLANGAIQNATLTYVGSLSANGFFSEYPDFLAFVSAIIVFCIISVGAKFSLTVNNLFTICNLVVMFFIISAGFYFADIKNWTNTEAGGFLPFGFTGALSGSASAFFAYIGFEGIAIAGEEAKNPSRTLPMATFISIVTVTVIYVVLMISLTLMVPYYDVDASAAFPEAFATRGNTWIKYTVAAGSLIGITASFLGFAFSLGRAVYAMAADGLLFKFLGYIHPQTKTPVIAIAVFGILCSICSLFVDLHTLVEFLSIGTLASYTIVAACIIIIRYQPMTDQRQQPIEEIDTMNQSVCDNASMIQDNRRCEKIGTLKKSYSWIPFLQDLEPGDACVWATSVMGLCMVGLTVTSVYGFDFQHGATWWSLLLVILFSIGIIFFYIIIILHEKNTTSQTFQVSYRQDATLSERIVMVCAYSCMIVCRVSVLSNVQ